MPDKDNFNCVVDRRIQFDDKREERDPRSELRDDDRTERRDGDWWGGVPSGSRSDVYASARCESIRDRICGRQEQHTESGTADCGDGAGPTLALNILQDPIHSNGVSPCLSKGSANGECAIGIVERFTQPISLDRAAYNQGKNASYDIGVDEDGTAFTVTAKGPGLVKE